MRVKILEIDSERRRLSLSTKRVEGQVLPVRPITPPAEGDAGDLDDVPELGLSEDVFASPPQTAEPEVTVVEEEVAPPADEQAVPAGDPREAEAAAEESATAVAGEAADADSAGGAQEASASPSSGS